jgi:hypothetical protein
MENKRISDDTIAIEESFVSNNSPHTTPKQRTPPTVTSRMTIKETITHKTKNVENITSGHIVDA